MGQFAGSVPSAPATSDVLRLTLQSSLSTGLRYNLGAISESSFASQARAQRTIARSELLPHLDMAISEVYERVNLRTQGVETNTFPESVTFNYYDARVARLKQTVFDVVKTDNLHSASESAQASMQQALNARDLVTLAVAGSYLQMLATTARISAAQAQVETARAIFQQASDRHALGLAPQIDVARSQVELQTEEQSLRALQAQLESQSLRMARLIGLPPAQRFVLADEFDYSPLAGFTEEGALETARSRRADLKGATLAVKAAQSAEKAAHAERLPALNISADFGAAGITPSRMSTGVYTAAATLTVPLYEGGRTKGDIDVAKAAVRQRSAELQDQGAQVEQDVRQAFIDLRLAEDQVRLAKSNVELARETLTQSRDRFAVGVTDTVEVVQAEQSVVQADNEFITAVFQHNLGKVSLARAMGDSDKTLLQLVEK
jgi:outer membrane protein TolC